MSGGLFNNFSLIVVLFILLIIVGCACYGGYGCYGGLGGYGYGYGFGGKGLY
ncbi:MULTISPECIES: YjcZ family sporulation protein [Fictibacillus]|uniref:YjcZ family sporulation protein n=1 Tax=Fictibacillus terranigra TaxID=3058424 RepID=A0ABT8E3K7_9BACL|nr:YjcZ family sporulation protein [Fictibacillus sp. CENA-BCM004]MDN4072490.1 YjcZ family sporulation protein [Fictibacillus sp. CENA-BCM004]